MITCEDLYFDLPNFEYDIDTLLEISDEYYKPKYSGIHRLSKQPTRNSEHSPHRLMFFNDLPEDFRHLPLISDIAELFSNVGSQSDGVEGIYKRLFFFNVQDQLEFHIDDGDDYAVDPELGLNHSGTPYAGPNGPTGRSFGFNLPIRGCDRPTCWMDKFDGDIICEHYYTSPALINTEQIHGCPGNQGERLFLSLGGFYESLRDVKHQLIGEGKVF
jgi:hypothetical protein